MKNMNKIYKTMLTLCVVALLIGVAFGYPGMTNSTTNDTTSNATKSVNVTSNTKNTTTTSVPINGYTTPAEVVETPVPCNEYVASHPEIYPISSCQQIVSSWSNSITKDGNIHITVDVGTVVKFSITTNSDAKLSSVTAEPNNVDKYLYYGYRTSFGDVKFDKIGYYNINLAASNSFARGGVTWNVDVVNPNPNTNPLSYEQYVRFSTDANLPGQVIENIIIKNTDTRVGYFCIGINMIGDNACSENKNNGVYVSAGSSYIFVMGRFQEGNNPYVYAIYTAKPTYTASQVYRPTYTAPVKVIPIQQPTMPSAQIIYYVEYDNIVVDHKIELCNVVSDDEHAITGGFDKNCGNPDLNIVNYPLDLAPSGGNSGKISASEMVMVKVITSGSMSLIPWRTQSVNMSWYDGSDNRLMFSTISQANNIDNRVQSFIGHFSHEINKPGKYYVDVDVIGFGSSRVVFNVISVNSTQTYTSPTVTINPVPVVTINPPALGSETDNTGPGCWDSYVGFGVCTGGVATKIGIGIVVGIGKTIAGIFGL